MITIEDLVVSYEKGKNVIDGLNLAMPDGTIHGVVGLNGAGKTTLLNSVYGLKRFDSGIIRYNDHPMNKKEMSFLVTENYFYSNITGREYLALFTSSKSEVEKWNQLFMLPLDTVIDHYSSGMKKKLALMGILRQDKPVMILDEPFNGLDIETCRIIRQILLKLKEHKKTIIITSHIIETLTNLCDHIHYLENGKIKFSKGKEEFKEFEMEIFASIENKNELLIRELTGYQPL
jgi:ABC-2 type transport system ATP-binding protein